MGDIGCQPSDGSWSSARLACVRSLRFRSPRKLGRPLQSPFFVVCFGIRTASSSDGMDRDDGAVSGTEVPFEATGLIIVGLQTAEHFVPDAGLAPADEAIISRLPGSIAAGQITPSGSGGQDPEDAVDDRAMGTIRASAFSGMFRWQEFGNLLPLLVVGFEACHSVFYLRK